MSFGTKPVFNRSLFGLHRSRLHDGRSPLLKGRQVLRGLSDESGQATVLAATCVIVLVLFLGLAIDVGSLRLAKRRLQGVADAAAVAAALEVRICGGTPNCAAMQSAALSSLSENGYSGATVVTNCGAMPSSGFAVMIDNGPCAMGSSDPNNSNKAYVEVVVQEQEPMYFARMAGYNNFTMSARSEASRPPNAPCIYALDQSNAGAISVLAGVGIRSQCGVVDESSSSVAFSCLVGAMLDVPSITIAGGGGGLLCGLGSVIKTNASVPTPSDPLAYLPTPSVGACGAKSGSEYYGSANAVNVTLPGSYVFHPGVYCGGISITAALAVNVTFTPGTYILETGPGLLGLPSGGLNLTLSLLSNIQGTGVTFYNLGPVGSISITAPIGLGLNNFALSAPTSGMYGGVLFFQDPGNTSAGTFIASLVTGSKLEGAIYLPTAQVTYAVGAVSSAYTILVAKDLNFNVTLLSTFGNDYSSLSTGSPLNGDHAALMQ